MTLSARRSHCLMLCLALLLTLFLGSCAERKAANEAVDNGLNTANTALQQIQPPREQAVSALTEVDTPWFGNTAVPAQSGELLPERLDSNNALVLTFEQALTLDEIAARIQAATGLRVMLDRAISVPASGGAPTMGGGNETRFLPADGTEVTGGRMVWQGKLSNLLDQVADKFDAEWTYSGNNIRISQQVVRTFMLNALAGSTDVGGSVTSGGAASGPGLPQQSVDSTSKLAFWEEIQKTIDNIITGRARASYSPATGTITVAGYPSAVKAAEDYLLLQNKLRLRRVSIEANVLSVLLDKSHNNNLNVDLVIKGAFGSQPFVYSSGVSSTEDETGRTLSAGILRSVPTNLAGENNVQAAVTALSAVAERVAVEYSGTLVTLSDQPAPLQVSTKRAYVARVSGSSSDTTSSSTLEPGTLDLGLNMNILPRVIEQDRIMLRIALGITDLVRLREFSNGSESNPTKIQLPEVDSTGFLQNAVLQSGETLVLAGFERKSANDQRQGVGSADNWLLGGGANYGQRREIRVLLLRAVLLPEDPVSIIRQ